MGNKKYTIIGIVAVLVAIVAIFATVFAFSGGAKSPVEKIMTKELLEKDPAKYLSLATINTEHFDGATVKISLDAQPALFDIMSKQYNLDDSRKAALEKVIKKLKFSVDVSKVDLKAKDDKAYLNYGINVIYGDKPLIGLTAGISEKAANLKFSPNIKPNLFINLEGFKIKQLFNYFAILVEKDEPLNKVLADEKFHDAFKFVYPNVEYKGTQDVILSNGKKIKADLIVATVSPDSSTVRNFYSKLVEYLKTSDLVKKLYDHKADLLVKAVQKDLDAKVYNENEAEFAKEFIKAFTTDREKNFNNMIESVESIYSSLPNLSNLSNLPTDAYKNFSYGINYYIKDKKIVAQNVAVPIPVPGVNDFENSSDDFVVKLNVETVFGTGNNASSVKSDKHSVNIDPNNISSSTRLDLVSAAQNILDDLDGNKNVINELLDDISPIYMFNNSIEKLTYEKIKPMLKLFLGF